MNKAKIAFLIVIFLILIVVASFFYSFYTQMDPNIGKFSNFQITQISSSGGVYRDLSMTKTIDIRKINFSNEMYLKLDSQTSMEILFSGTYFTVLPNSYLYYQPMTQEVCLYLGELYWEKKVESKKVDIAVGIPENIVNLSDRGRLKFSETLLEIWNYSGNLKLMYQNENYDLVSNKYFQAMNQNNKTKIITILPAPEFISPKKTTIKLDKPESSIMRINWKAVPGAKNYRIKIYSSILKENLLYESEVAFNRKNISLYNLNDNKEFCWQVFPFDADNELEGSPSKIGFVKLTGKLLFKDTVSEVPFLEIENITVSGNMVLIKGVVDTNSRLFIDNELIKIDSDGEFIHTMTFENLGVQEIIFKLISPTEVENIIKRQVTIFDE